MIYSTQINLMKTIIYQVLPRLWGKGKFSDWDEKALGYVHDTLGADAIWYTGMIRHATGKTEKVVKGEAGSPYAIVDWYDVNPYLADDPLQRMVEFEALLGRTHAAGLRVILDFIPNHVAREYHGAKTPKGCRRLGADDDRTLHWAPENDFYYYPGQDLCLPVDADGYEESPARASGNAFTPYPDENDWYETVKLNYCDFRTGTWNKMRDVVRFWAGKGVDGFRCDMVELVPPQFMKWLIAEIKAEFPQVQFIAEVYETDKYRLYTEDVGFDLLYDKSGLYDRLRAVMAWEQGAYQITRNWQMLGDLQPRMLNFLENHDEQRLASDFFAGSPEAGYAALAVSLLLNNAPFMLYFGQEIGERGMDDEPFSGVNGRTSIFDWWTVESIQRLIRWIRNPRSGLRAEERAVLKRYRELITLSKRPAFSSGRTYDLCYCQGEGFDPERDFAFLRSDGREVWLVAAHFAPYPADLAIRIPEGVAEFLGVRALPECHYLHVGANDAGILRLL